MGRCTRSSEPDGPSTRTGLRSPRGALGTKGAIWDRTGLGSRHAGNTTYFGMITGCPKCSPKPESSQTMVREGRAGNLEHAAIDQARRVTAADPDSTPPTASDPVPQAGL